MAYSAAPAAPWKEYFTPNSVAEALDLLHRHAPDSLVVAGGTDLILDLQQGNHKPVRCLVDVTHIPGLADIRLQNDSIFLGSAVTHAQIESNALLRQHATALVESCGVVGGPQVRNVATLGGNVAHALPAADGTIGLLALEAEVQRSSWSDGAPLTSWHPIASVFAGPGRNTLRSDEIITGFRFAQRAPWSGSAFDRIMRPQGVALPILGVAACLHLEPGSDRVRHAAIVIGPAGPVPFRASMAEQVVCADPHFGPNAIDAAIASAHQEVRFRSSKNRASSAYRHEVLDVLLRRVLQRAFERAQNHTS
jgi:carbon-monoxide dehydrogenase medium subunit